jgi:mRNA interferase MazF
VNRGEVWTVAEHDRRWRVVVVSTDAFNVSGAAYCAPVTRRPGGELPPYAVPLVDADPVSGVVLAGTIVLIPAESGAERVGYLTGSTMAALATALRDLFDL